MLLAPRTIGILALAFLFAGTSDPASGQDAANEGTAAHDAPIVIEGKVRNRDGKLVDRPSTRGERRSFDRYPYETSEGGLDLQLLSLLRRSERDNVILRYGYAGHMARCAIASMGNRATQYVSTQTDSDQRPVLEAFNGRHRQCVNSAERAAPPYLVNAALAELLVIRNVDTPRLRADAVEGKDARRFIVGPEPESHMATVARCLAIFSPGLSYDILFTRPGSLDERAAFDRLYGQSPECGLRERPKGFSPIYQRSYIAVALFALYDVASIEAKAPSDR